KRAIPKMPRPTAIRSLWGRVFARRPWNASAQTSAMPGVARPVYSRAAHSPALARRRLSWPDATTTSPPSAPCSRPMRAPASTSTESAYRSKRTAKPGPGKLAPLASARYPISSRPSTSAALDPSTTPPQTARRMRLRRSNIKSKVYPMWRDSTGLFTEDALGCALVQGCPEARVLGAHKLRILIEQREGLAARLGQKRQVASQVAKAQPGQARLPGPVQLAEAAQGQIRLRNAEAVGR